MSGVDAVKYLRRISGKFEKVEGIKVFEGTNSVVCLSSNNCITIFNYSINLTWDSNGYLTEVSITGTDQEGNTRTFKKTLTWSTEGYLQNVSSWQEV